MKTAGDRSTSIINPAFGFFRVPFEHVQMKKIYQYKPNTTVTGNLFDIVSSEAGIIPQPCHVIILIAFRKLF